MPQLKQIELDFLRNNIEEKINLLGKPVADIVNELEIRTDVGRATLYRIWNYQNYSKPKNISKDTLYELVKKVLNYDDWSTYFMYMQNQLTEESLFDPESINVDELKIGSKITIGWKSKNYYYIVKYIDEFEFKVLESKIEEMEVGKIFEARSFYLKYVVKKSKNQKGFPFHPTICYSTEWNEPNIFIGSKIEEFDDYLDNR